MSVVCSKCGGTLAHETFVMCGEVRRITGDGQIQEDIEVFRRYGWSGDHLDIVYCLNCNHQEKFTIDESGSITLISKESKDG